MAAEADHPPGMVISHVAQLEHLNTAVDQLEKADTNHWSAIAECRTEARTSVADLRREIIEALNEMRGKLDRLPVWATVASTAMGGTIGALMTAIYFILNYYRR
jgi:hypothetical protein